MRLLFFLLLLMSYVHDHKILRNFKLLSERSEKGMEKMNVLEMSVLTITCLNALDENRRTRADAEEVSKP